MMNSGSTASALRDANPLPLSAGEFVRIAAQVSGEHIDLFQQRGGAVDAVGLARADAVNPHRLDEGGLDRHPRIQRAVGVLENDLHLPADLPQLAAAQRGDVDAVVVHLAASRFDQPQNGPPGGGLAAA